MAWQLYLPKPWAADAVRRRTAGVPAEVGFATKTEIALTQLQALLAEGAPKYCVLADAGYGVDTAFRRRLEELGRPYVVGITSSVVAWPPGIEPLRPKRYSGTGRPPATGQCEGPVAATARQRLADDPLARGHQRLLSSRFAAVRVRHAGGNAGRARLHPERWLLIEWPAGDAEPLAGGGFTIMRR